MLLSDLLEKAGLRASNITGDCQVEIGDIATDSRLVTPGTLFMAVPGSKHNGAQFIPSAIKNGAAALMIAQRAVLDMPATVPVIRVDQVRPNVAKLAACFFAPQPKNIVAVTGTDGKTSIVNFVQQLWALCGHSAASLGTLGLCSPNAVLNDAFPNVNTSPEPVLLHRTLRDLVAHQIQYVAIEASSHGLAQNRVDGVHFKAAAFTNLTRDHLDYHGTQEAYLDAKKRLFDSVLPADGVAVVNVDDPHAGAILQAAKSRDIQVIEYGKNAKDYRIETVSPTPTGLHAKLIINGLPREIDLPLYGEFQLYNILAAIGLAQACGAQVDALIAQLPNLVAVKGRLQQIAVLKNGARCFVDYAHTPAALENMLQCLKAHSAAKLHVVFGCGGERDTGKRPQMGEVAVRLADHVIITDDNPRNEDAAKIRAEIMATAKGADQLPDRAEAIITAVQQLKPNDVLVVAGKGHENYQLIGEHKHAFDDAKMILKAVGML
jgi:UDP-N-acetylmuramoyl-L-alanyl-D-glutamate--2,6-diaminopimelate ligase